MNTIITTGYKYADIDALACALAYKELLELEGKKSEVVLPHLNHSITPTIRNWPLDYKTAADNLDAHFIIMDVSEPTHLPAFVKHDKITELFDHHFGFEKEWQEKLGDNCHIEPVGACATLIWEAFKKKGLDAKISMTSANLLSVAIVSNTLNFKASITHERDHKAFAELAQYRGMPEGWIEQYFTAQSQIIFANVQEAVKSDTKIQEIRELNRTFVIGQIELWDSKKFIAEHQPEIKQALESYGNPYWFFTSPSISEGINYLYTENEEIKKLLQQTMGAEFEQNLGKTKKLWMRKEILKVLYAKTTS